MIDLHFWPTPNGYKILMFLEEAKLRYHLVPVNINAGDQFKPDFLKIAPNNRMPAIVDHAPLDNSEPLSVFESGAILLYLAGKYGIFIPKDLRGQVMCLQWLMWQMGGLGPMAGQNHHFAMYAPEKIEYAIKRYVNETGRLYGVLNKRLAGRDFICGSGDRNYTIADMACYPWIVPHERQSQNLDDFPHIKKWFARIRERPATIKSYDIGERLREGNATATTPQAKDLLFNQSAQTVK